VHLGADVRGHPSLAPPDPDWIAARLDDVTTHLAARIDRVTVRIVSDDTMSELHCRYCDIDSTTDVLTFPSDLSESDGVSVDIAVCADEAMRTAERNGNEAREELLLYALHGLLHCCGHDDHTPEAYERMHAEEDRILTAIGVGALFDGRRESGGRAKRDDDQGDRP